MRFWITCCLLLPMAKVSGQAAKPRIWPLRTTTRVVLTPEVTVLQHRTRVFGLVIWRYRVGCHSEETKKYLGWKTKRSRLIVCRADGQRLAARRYSEVMLTTDGRILGLRFHRRGQTTAEYLTETGQREVIANFVTEDPRTVARKVNSRGNLMEYLATPDGILMMSTSR